MTSSDVVRRPVIVGVAQVTHRVEDAAEGREPLDLATEALLAAATDAADGSTGTSSAASVTELIDSLDVVNVISWMYEDLPAQLAAAVGATPARAEHSDWGGDRPTLLIDRASERIARGECRVAAIVGAESLKSVEMAFRGGQLPEWTPPPAGAAPPNPRDHVSELAWNHGLRMPTEVYPLFENALRSRLGLSHDENQDWSGHLWSSMSSQAAKNPDSWDSTPRTAEEIITISGRNRMICHPYPKLMNARIAVNQAAAVILMDADLADELGIPQEQRVSPVAGAGVADPEDFLARVGYDRSPAMEVSLQSALDRAGLKVEDCDLLELYSCFPCVPKMAIDALGLARDVAPSVAGGLTFFGGPGNDYMLHAVVAMVRAMRGGDGQTALMYGNGGFATKHHTLLLRAGTSTRPYAANGSELDAALQRTHDEIATPTVISSAEGTATIETWTMPYGPDGEPTVGIVVCRLADGSRTAANVEGGDLDRLAAADPVGAGGTLSRKGDRNIFTFN